VTAGASDGGGRARSGGRAARYGGEGVTVSSVGKLSLAVAAAPYVELGLEVLWGDSSLTIIEELGGRR
jgi:hypothetical protein